MSNKVPSSEVTKMNSTIFSRFLRALRRRQLKQNIWKMVWFSMSLYKFKSSLCSPCNQSTQRRRKRYCCWVSSSPIKRAEHETCKYDVNHHGWAHHQGEKQIHSFQCRKDQMDSSHHRCRTSPHRCHIFTPADQPSSKKMEERCSLPSYLIGHSQRLKRWWKLPMLSSKTNRIIQLLRKWVRPTTRAGYSSSSGGYSHRVAVARSPAQPHTHFRWVQAGNVRFPRLPLTENRYRCYIDPRHRCYRSTWGTHGWPVHLWPSRGGEEL